jgi:hypothetical protein
MLVPLPAIIHGEMGRQSQLISLCYESHIELVSVNKIDWDELLPIVFFSLQNNLQGHMVYSNELVYILHPLMPTQYVILAFRGD